MNDRLIELQLPFPAKILEALAERIADLVADRLARQLSEQSPWLDFDAARAYLGFSRDRLYKLTAAKSIPCRKQAGGQRLLFHQGELDHWLETTHPRLDPLP